MRIPFLLAMFSLFIGCKKGNELQSSTRNIPFQVLVLDYTTNLPVQGAHVGLFVSEGASINYASFPFLLKRTDYKFLNYDSAVAVTDNQGKASFRLDVNHNRKFFQFFTTKDGFRQVTNKPLTEKRMDRPVFDTLYMDKPSFLEFHLNQVSPASGNDTLFLDYTLYSGTPNFLSLMIGRSHQLLAQSGMVILKDTLSYRQTDKVLVRWRLNGSGQMNERLVDVAEHGTKTVRIDY